MEAVTKIIVAHGRCLLHGALADRLKREAWIEVCGAGSDCDDIRALLEKHHPNLLVANISTSCSYGTTELKKIKKEFRDLRILAFSCDSEFEGLHIGLALRSGADGYISSADSPDELIKAIRMVCSGERYISEKTMLRRRINARHEDFLTALSRREAEVFCLTGCGYAPKRIAEKLKLSVKTVESYRERIRMKLDIANGADLLYFATGLMLSAARGGANVPEDPVVNEMLAATA